MNKTLFKKVKDLCKDTGLSEKYLTAITEKMGGSIEDDSTCLLYTSPSPRD